MIVAKHLCDAVYFFEKGCVIGCKLPGIAAGAVLGRRHVELVIVRVCHCRAPGLCRVINAVWRVGKVRVCAMEWKRVRLGVDCGVVVGHAIVLGVACQFSENNMMGACDLFRKGGWGCAGRPR